MAALVQRIRARAASLPTFDIPFLLILLLLLSYGLIMLFSAGYAVALYRRGDAYTYIRPQLLFAALGVALFLLLLLRGMSIAVRARDKFGALLVVGFVVQVTLQAILNMAVVTNTIPNTGISLPFFSSGGTSLLMLLGEMGIELSVSRQTDMV